LRAVLGADAVADRCCSVVIGGAGRSTAISVSTLCASHTWSWSVRRGPGRLPPLRWCSWLPHKGDW